MSAVVACATCGTEPRENARFCDGCGSAITASPRVAEYKQVTVLFTDVVHSMDIAAAVGAERFREIMYELFNRSAGVVQRYEGTVDKFTGDGLMALFGAPAALEDHALRACISALEIQSVVRGLSADVLARDSVDLKVRIGLNSGQVIAGEIGDGSYTAVGHTVGMAQRMEAAAEPGGILCSASTARLVEHSAVLGPTAWITVKSVAEPVAAQRLERVEPNRIVLGRDEGHLVGRDAELAALLDNFYGGRTSIAGVVGEPGLGKSRLIREFAAEVGVCGAEVVIARCESHTANVPLHALSRVLREVFGLHGLSAATARAHVLAALEGVVEPESGHSDILIDLLGVRDPQTPVPVMDPDARRSRLIEAMGKVANTRPARIVFIMEDIHWVDAASEDVLAKFVGSLTAGRSLFVATFRPEYRGPLRDMSGTMIALAPLDHSNTVALATELIGRHPSVMGVAERIAQQSAGNPFFIGEIVRDLFGRGVFLGSRGDYRLAGELDSIAVPATVRSVLAARIDRLTAQEKSILNAAAVIGTSFELDVLLELVPGVESGQLRSLVSVELIDQIRFLPQPRYAFRHPLVRAVSYDSQLNSTRADCHRRLATSIEMRDPDAVERNAALIAQHLEAAAELTAAYSWYMRSADWLRHRDIKGARESWGHARSIADKLPGDQEDVTGKRIAPRALLTSTAWHVAQTADGDRCYEELRELATQSGDLLSLALGMAGRLTAMVEVADGRPREAAALAVELMRLFDEIQGPASARAEILTAAALAHYGNGELTNALRTLERLREIPPEEGGASLAPATVMAGVIKTFGGKRAAGRRDIRAGMQLARESDPLTIARAVGYRVDLVVLGFDVVDEDLLTETEGALRLAESFGHPYGLAVARWAHGSALLRSDDSRRSTGFGLLRLSRSDGIDFFGSMVDADLTADVAQPGGRDASIDNLCAAVHSEIDYGETLFVGHSLGVLVQLLVGRGTPDDVSQARDVVVRFENLLPPDPEPAVQLWPLQYRARLADAEGDAAVYSETVIRYRNLAERLDARGHLAVANQLASDPAFRSRT